MVITRFAPSPTGYLHIGGARTALYNYLFARKSGGKFILRIEDTDLERSTPESIQAILDGMKWLGLDWDEGPYFQTKRFDLYQQAIDQMVAQGKAYPCFCQAADLEKKRVAAEKNKIKYQYDRTCYRLSPEERAAKIKANTPHVVRFYSPDHDTITIADLIKGEVHIQASELDDLILRRTDGSPTYNLTVVVDDVAMGITHVIRGDDHLNNTPRQIQLYQALGHKLPLFAHLPMILGADKKRLSKRHGATSVIAYRDMGYLPQALLNFLVRFGWSYQDKEIFTLQEMIDCFNLEACSPSAGVFNPEKLLWLNGHYIREAQPRALAALVKEFLAKEGVDVQDEGLLVEAIAASQLKVKTLKEMASFIKLFFTDVPVEPDVIQKTITEPTKPILKAVAGGLETTTALDHDTINALFERVCAEFGVKKGDVANPVRVALSGLKISPSVYDMIRLFGKDESIKRIKKYCL